ncbi:hypothetical protein CQ040_15765 [Microbacterium sp. MYb54]|nr:hypothetical protein CQ032_15115 [Microbacterium sp. MYb43]PQZ75096.1 hypothetical protein CQ031_14470 [Microbacterium sp. MYb40]PRB19390.1 hypothetical protein CQ040_15765 [Microbacterium sp. MYb54]PRB24591.1 hypothetical protein CQ037_16270 [Microbacterium sp. MYb50]PRB63702.1 hypothetical protein CQ021_15875 [Microbacterium sp. MYb24]
MRDSWNDRVDSSWDPEQTLEAMHQLVAERLPGDPEALYEWASVHDFLGREAEVIPLCRVALGAGVGGDKESQGVVQLTSPLRNVGQAAVAIALPGGRPDDPSTGSAGQAFLALALYDEGRHDEALSVALLALAPTLSLDCVVCR